MEIITGSGKVVKLVLIDRNTGRDWAVDLIGSNMDGLPMDEDGRYIVEDDLSVIIQDLLDRYQTMEDTIEEIGREARKIAENVNAEIGDYPDVVMQALADAGLLSDDVAAAVTAER